jgi:hypothetical protein
VRNLVDHGAPVRTKPGRSVLEHGEAGGYQSICTSLHVNEPVMPRYLLGVELAPVDFMDQRRLNEQRIRAELASIRELDQAVPQRLG